MKSHPARLARAAALALALTPLGAGAALAADDGPPPPPKAAGGAKVETIGQGVPTPTEFAFAADGSVFVAAAGAEDGSAPGGLFVLKDGRATLVPDGPRSVFGVAAKGDVVYLSSGPQILAAKGWDGTRFASIEPVFTAPKKFTGFNGIAVGPNGRIYAGVTMGAQGDHKKVSAPYAQSVISMTTAGKQVKTVVKGLRQPWMVTFSPGNPNPLVTVLGQENLGRRQPPDYVIRAKQGQDYGFPTCNWSKPKACKGKAKPISLLPAHSSPMGIGVLGGKLYVALFTGTGRGPQVLSLPLKGGSKTTPVLSGFAAPVVALGTHDGYLYAGDLTGAIYRVKA
jgi:glucose/arabinose dehydrogenase